MFGWGGATRIYLAAGATDMRKGFEGLYGMARDRLLCDPLSGHMVGVIAFALEEHVGLADGVGFGVDFLAVEVRADFLPLTEGDGLQGLFRDGKHAPSAAGAVVDLVRAGLNGAGDGTVTYR